MRRETAKGVMGNRPLYFITSNKNKFEEAQEILRNIEIEQFDVDLPEIQELDSRAVIKAKLEVAFEHHAGPFIVDDVPDGSDKTYAEMGREEKNTLSHRRLALDKLKEFLEKSNA